MIKLFTNPEFFDIPGVMVFLFIILLAGWMLYTDKKPKKWVIVLLLIIGLISLIIDSILVYVNYLK